MECVTPRVNFDIIYGLFVTMLYQCRFINYNKCNTLVDDADNVERYRLYEKSLYCPNFTVNTLKNFSFNLKNLNSKIALFHFQLILIFFFFLAKYIYTHCSSKKSTFRGFFVCLFFVFLCYSWNSNYGNSIEFMWWWKKYTLYLLSETLFYVHINHVWGDLFLHSCWPILLSV